ncbi:hypothetical protein BKP37_04575 [Anaerobacillus alkalilacustris]|uniref:Uncharacterized protein n=1 Tax=Anaerobacillus alkalilacustris TaxID=393763 RepID=A0A1S2LW82_9BACI|nr:hypothetical protein [Anaerobacillus alkalilacustris]OIJ16811.1 hypothetical protein BKP37_04575 [Anaerobacillus alkalilacustris]
MITFRGDAWKFYCKLRRTKKKGRNLNELKELNELDEIQTFYETIEDRALINIRYRMLKEKKGSGMIPVFVSAIPWLLFIFSKQLQQWLFQEGAYLWVVFIILYVFILLTSVIVHFRENAWAHVHTEMIEDILSKRNGGENHKKKSHSYY